MIPRCTAERVSGYFIFEFHNFNWYIKYISLYRSTSYVNNISIEIENGPNECETQIPLVMSSTPLNNIYINISDQEISKINSHDLKIAEEDTCKTP